MPAQCSLSVKTMLSPRVYSEEQPGDAATALFIKKLSEEDAGEYRCSAIYASNQRLEAKVDISVYSEYYSSEGRGETFVFC